MSRTVTTVPPLTALSHGAGCGCKLGPDELSGVLSALPRQTDPRVIVGATTGDDAGVFAFGTDRSIVATVDFFTPIVDDPALFGAIAATNAVSDIYAMGALPLFALSLVAFPRDRLPIGDLERIVAAGAAKLAEAGVPTIGGHTIDDPEPKFGYAVMGELRGQAPVTHAGAEAGDFLYLTKPLCSGLVSTAMKAGKCPEPLAEQAVRVMTHLNRRGAEAMLSAGAHAATDVTGFGLLGHLRNLQVGAVVEADRVPVLDGVLDLAQAGFFPGGSRRNLAALESNVDWGDSSEMVRLMLCDAQTSGGLLVAVPPSRAADFQRQFDGEPYPASRIGVVTSPGDPIRVR